MKKVIFLAIFMGCLSFQGCATSADIFTHSGELKRPTTPINTDLTDFPFAGFSQNSITELKANLVDGVNLPLLYTLVKFSNPQLLRKIAEVHSAQGDRTNAGVLENPEIRIYADSMPLSSGQSTNESRLGMRIVQPIDISGGIAAEKKITQAELVKASWNLIDTEQKIKILCTTAFFEYWIQAQIVEYMKILKDARENQYAIIEKEVKAGLKTKLMLLEYNRAKTDAELTFQDELLKLEQTKNNIKRLIGDFTLTLGSPKFQDNGKNNIFINAEENVFTDIDKARWIKNHPAYMSATQQISIKEAELLKYSGQHLKKLKVGIAFEFDNDGDNQRLNALLEIPLPLWNFGTGRKFKAIAQIFIAQKHAEEVLSRLNNEIENALFGFNTLKRKLDSIQGFLSQKRLMHQEIIKGQASVTTFFDVLDSKSKLMEYEIKALRIKLELYKTYFYLFVSFNNKFPKFN
ncbi:MAG: TolC family protein [Planctomycetes bacterium]|nr:TolC family protein [Planctomycetota bacterium]